jgi:hypothetical protein
MTDLKEQKARIAMLTKDLNVEEITGLPCEVYDVTYALYLSMEDRFLEPEINNGLLVYDKKGSIYIHEDGGVEVFTRKLKEGEDPTAEKDGDT